MRTTTTGSIRSLKPIGRAALIAALGLVGVFGPQAGELGTTSLSEDLCLSCAYEDGLPGSIEAPFAVEADTVLADDSVSGEPRDDGSTFGQASADRPRVIVPSSDTNRSERPRWSKSEKALMWSFVSLSAIDAYQTMNAPGDVREANPLIGSWAGDHPSALETLLFKGATTYGMYKLAGRIKKRSTRRIALVMMNFVQLSVAAHNEEVTGGILF